ncbi:MAG: YbjQ family protein [Oscillospiraceae bacterium]|nr:YbjQ family protein [Oscillospiraceae bacterium]
MVLVNTDYITGKNLAILGLVKGSVVQAKHIGRDIMASFKTIVGGEIVGYTDLMNEARAIATHRMIEEARAMGADAVVNVRFVSAEVMQGCAEVIAYGTAAKYV